MKPIRLSEAEASAVLAWADGELGHTQTVDVPRKMALSIIGKVKRALEPTSNVAVGPLEQALIVSSRSKVVPLVTGHGQASVRAGKLGVTVEQAELVGRYIASQGWMRGPFTVLDLLNKWPQYLSKATATQPPPEVPAGFGAVDVRQESLAAPVSPAPPPGGRPLPGFGSTRKGR